MGYVYLLCDGEKFKIGMTNQKNIHNRISELQTGNPNEIFLSAYYKTENPYIVEQYMHRKYFNKNVKNEWFDLEANDIINFKSNCEKYDKLMQKTMIDNPFFKFK